MTHSTLDERRHQPTGELVSQLAEQVSTLVRDELTLARTELVEKGKRAGTGAGLLGATGLPVAGSFRFRYASTILATVAA